MALPFQDIDLFANQGLDNRQEEKVSDNPALLENAEWVVEGSLSKRRGYDALGTYTGSDANNTPAFNVQWFIPGAAIYQDTLRGVTGLGTRRSAADVDELLTFDSRSINSWSPDGFNADQNGGRVHTFVGYSNRSRVTSVPHGISNGSMMGASYAQGGGMHILAWVDASGSQYQLKATIRDTQTDSPIITPVNLTSPFTSVPVAPRVLTMENPSTGIGQIFVVYIDPSNGLSYRQANFLNPQGIQNAGIVIDAAATVGRVCGMDADVWLSSSVRPNPVIAVAYLANNALRLSTLDATGTVATNTLGSGTYRDVLDMCITSVPNILLQSGAGTGTPYDGLAAVYTDQNGAYAGSVPVTGRGGIWKTTGSQFQSIGASQVTASQCDYAVGIHEPNNSDGSPDGLGLAGRVSWYVEWRGVHSNSLGVETDLNRRYSYVSQYTQSGSRAVTDSGIVMWHAELAGHPFDVVLGQNTSLVTGIRNRVIPATHYNDLESVHVLMAKNSNASAYRFVPYATFDRDLAYPPRLYKPRFVTGSNGRLVGPSASRGRLEVITVDGSDQGLPVSRLRTHLATLDFDPPEPDKARYGYNLALGGGNLRSYDGAAPTEMAWTYFPVLSGAALDASQVVPNNDPWASFLVVSPGTIPAGIYTYYATYHWTDAQGRESRSSPGPGAQVSILNATPADVLVYVPAQTMTERTDAVVKLWRTENNGAVPHLITSGSGLEIGNVVTGSFVGWVDRMQDHTLVSQEVLYTYGGELDSLPPPPMRLLCTWNNRLWGVSEDDGLTLWFSKALSPDLAPEFNDGLTLSVDPDGGRVTAMAAMDDKLIIFKRNRVYYTWGDGPDATGGGGNFAVPRLVPSDVGCVDSRSVALVAGMGLFFRSTRGIQLLDRGLNVQFIGAPVTQFANREVTGAAIIEDLNQVRFTFRSGSQACYDTFLGRWTTVSSSLPSDASVAWNGRHVVAGARGLAAASVDVAGAAYASRSGSFQDAGAAYNLRIRTPWVKVAGIEGYQKVHEVGFLGTYKSDHVLSMSVEYDYNNSGSLGYTDRVPALGTGVSGVDTVGTVMVNAPESGSLYQFSHRPHRRRCQSIRLTFVDSQQSGTMESFTLEHVRFRIGTKPGAHKLPLWRKR